jgi:ribosome-binding protein aMBF1 (putative translation factor)
VGNGPKSGPSTGARSAVHCPLGVGSTWEPRRIDNRPSWPRSISSPNTQRVRELRKAQGYSQETFAAALALDRTYIGGIERGERNLALRNIEAMAQTLGISLSELMEGL